MVHVLDEISVFVTYDDLLKYDDKGVDHTMVIMKEKLIASFEVKGRG